MTARSRQCGCRTGRTRSAWTLHSAPLRSATFRDHLPLGEPLPYGSAGGKQFRPLRGLHCFGSGDLHRNERLADREQRSAMKAACATPPLFDSRIASARYACFCETCPLQPLGRKPDLDQVFMAFHLCAGSASFPRSFLAASTERQISRRQHSPGIFIPIGRWPGSKAG